MKKILPLLIAALLQFPLGADAQGLTGPADNVRWGGSSSTLIPGRNNQARWKLFQKHQQKLLGKTEAEVVAIFGKGGDGYEKNQRLYMIADYKRKAGYPYGTATEVAINYVKGKVESYTVILLH